MSERRQYDQEQDRAVEDSFPASDPPSFTPTSGAGKPGRGKAGEAQRDTEEAKPKGHPTDDRHEAETAAGRIEETEPPEKKQK